MPILRSDHRYIVTGYMFSGRRAKPQIARYLEAAQKLLDDLKAGSIWIQYRGSERRELITRKP